MRVLVLEDNLERIRYFIEVLGRYKLTVVDKADEAIDLLGTQVFDMIFLDNDLRDGGFGADVATYLSENSDNPNNKANIIIHCWDDRAAAAMRNKLNLVCSNVVNIKFSEALSDYLGLTNNK